MKTASRIFITLFVLLGLAGIMLVISESGLQAQTLAPRPETAGQVTVQASEPVAAILSQPVRDLEPAPQEPMLNREVYMKWLGEGIGVEGASIGLDPLISRSSNDGFSPDPLVTFEGVPSLSGVTPPDTIGDVGPNHYVQMTNFSFRIWDKGDPDNGVPPNPLIPPTLTGDLFAPLGGQCTNNFGDPIVLYDDLADRWLLSQFGLDGPLGMCIAISQTADPTGAYYLYFFPTPDFPDYPKLGVWPDAYLMGTNSGFPNSYFAFAFDREAMLDGDPATVQSVGGQANLMMPADVDGQMPPPAGDPGIFYTFYHPDGEGHPAGSERLAIYEFDVDWANPGNSTFTLAEELPIASFNYTICGFFAGGCIAQPGTGQLLDDIAWWPMFRFQYRNFGTYEAMVGNFTVDADGANHAGIRWFEVRKAAGVYTLHQEGTQFPTTDSRWMGSIAMDGSGNIALGYSVSSSSVVPSIRYATRLRTDALGTLSAEAEMWTGVGVQTGIHRWGDYSNMAVDPVDNCTFWYTTEYHDSNDSGFAWNTRVGIFRIPECTGAIGPTGTLEGTVTELGSGNPIEDANIFATNGITLTGSAVTDANGDYRAILSEGTYTVTASAFGYQPAEVTAVSIVSGTTTTVNFVLDLATNYTVEGTVTDVNTGWPLYARIDIDGYPGDAIWTDPETGSYSISLPEGIEYTFDVSAWVEGYLDESRDVGPLTANTQEDFALDVNVVSCTAPGYGSAPGSAIFADDFESGLGNWTATGLWHQESQTDTCGSLVAPFPSPVESAYFGQAGICNFDIGVAQGSLTMNSPAAIPASGALFKVWSFEETECGGNCSFDTRNVEISTDGSSWSGLGQGGTEGVWYQQTYDLSAYANQNIWLRFRFDSGDGIANNFFGWMIDDVDVSVPTCVPTPGGGLVVGNVYDGANTPLTGATVENETGEMVSTYDTPDDPNVDDGFYTIFSDGGSQDHWASYNSDYGVDLETVTVVVSDTVSQDFVLPSATLIYSPSEIEETMSIGDIVTNTVFVTNTGTYTLDFTVRIGDFTGPGGLMIRPHVEPVSVPASNGRFPLGNYAPSIGLAPADGEAVAASDAPVVRVPYGNTAYAVDAANGFYTAFDLDVPETLPNVAAFSITDFPGAGEVVDGYSYVIDANIMHQLDLATGTEIGTTPVTPPSGAQSYTGMALDPTSGDVYLSSCDISTSILYTLDMGSGTATQVGTITNSPCTIGIAIDGAGDLYGYDIVNDTLLSIDKGTAVGTVIGSIGFDANFGQGMGYDATTDQIYLAAFNNGTFQPELRIADLTTGNTTLVGVLGSTDPGVLVQLPWLGTELGSGGGGWAYAVPDSGTVPPGGSGTFDVVFDARSMYQVGEFTAQLSFSGNFVNVVPTMPLTMHLSCPTCGFLNGDITDSVTGDPVDASVNITNTGGFNVTLDGSSYAVAVPPGTYNLTVEATGYVGETDTAVVTQGVTTTVDFALDPAIAILSYSPSEIEEFMEIGDIVTNTVTVTNSGYVDLEFSVNIGGWGGPTLMIRPHVEPVSVPASNGRFPLGNYAPSIGLAPADGEAVAASDAPVVRVPYGNTAYAVDAANGFYTAFDLDVPETLPNVAAFSITDFPGAGEVVDGYSYVIDANIMHQLDLATGTEIGTTPVTPPSGAQSYTGMALDPTSGDVYLSSCDISTSILYTLDMGSGTATQVGTITNSPCTIGIAIDGAGDLYGYDIVNDTLLSIDKGTAVGTVIGSIGFDANFGQGMGYDATTDQIYLAAFNNGTFQPELRIADLTTGNTTLVGVLGSTDPGVLVQLPWLGTELGSGGGGWAYAVPDSGTVPPGGSGTFDVVFDARSMYQVGEFTAQLSFSGNFVNVVPTMPLTMHLSCPTCGFLNGDITDSVTGDPVDASVNITNTGGFNVTFDGSSYALAVPAGNYDFTVSANGYFSQTATVTAVQGVTVTTDFALTPIAALLEVDPGSFEVTVVMGETYVDTLELSNIGTIAFDFELSDLETGSPLQPLTDNQDGVPTFVPPAVTNFPAMSLQQVMDREVTDANRVINSMASSGDILLDQQPNQVNGLFSDSDCGLCGTGAQSIADNFSLASSETIGQIIFWTGYFPGDVPIDPDLLTVIFHEDSGGFPGTAISTESNVPYERVQTGVVLFGVHEWMHTLTLDTPVTLGPGNYWVEIYNETIGSSENFFWETGNPDTVGNGLTGSAWSTSVPGSGWNFDGATELAIQLLPGGVDAPWLSEDPSSGSLNVGEFVDVDLIFDTTVLTQTGTYTAELRIDGTFENNVDPLTVIMHVVEPEYGLAMSGDMAASGEPGEMVMYTMTITNTGNVEDTFDLTAAGHTWTTTLSDSSITLGAGESGTVMVHVTIPASAGDGDEDTTTVTATSTHDAGATASADMTTTAVIPPLPTYTIFMPILLKP